MPTAYLYFPHGTTSLRPILNGRICDTRARIDLETLFAASILFEFSQSYRPRMQTNSKLDTVITAVHGLNDRTLRVLCCFVFGASRQLGPLIILHVLTFVGTMPVSRAADYV